MRKRFVVALLAAVMCLGMAPSATALVSKDDALHKSLYPHAETVSKKLENAVTMIADASQAGVFGEITPIDSGLIVYRKGEKLYLPVSFVAEAFKISVGDNSESHITVNGVDINYEKPDGASDYFAEAKTLATALEKYIFIDARRGLVIISNVKGDFDESTPDEQVYDALCQVAYDRPSSGMIAEDVKKANPNLQHPRIFANQERFDQIRRDVNTDDTMKLWYENTKSEGEVLLSRARPLAPAVSSWGVGRDTTEEIFILAMLYKLTDDVRYAEKVKEYVFWACSIPSWNPSHFLDVAELVVGIAVGYDWLYDYFTPDERETIRINIIEKAIKPGMAVYLADEGGAWPTRTTNWNAVCNGGLIVAALAIGDEAEEAYEIIDYAFRGLEYMIDHYAPDGAWHESPSYWEYTEHFMNYMNAALLTATGKDYGYYSNIPGYKQTPYFLFHITGHTGIFNYHQSNPNSHLRITNSFYHAYRNKDKTIMKHIMLEMQNTNTIGSAREILWYNPEHVKSYEDEEYLDLDTVFKGMDTMTMRTSWTKSNTIYTGLHGGYNNTPHGQIDSGNFIIDALGERWAWDYGGDDYNLPGYWNGGEGGQRFSYFRLKAEAHNTVIVNPSGGTNDQKALSTARMINSESKPRGAFGVLDMTEALGNDVADAKRGLMLYDNRNQILVQDEITFKNRGDVCWFLQTPAEVTLSQNRKTATLELNGKRMIVRLRSDAPKDMIFYITEAKALPTSVNPDGQASNDGFTRLMLYYRNVKSITIPVTFTPVREMEAVPEDVYRPSELALWSIEDGELIVPEYPLLDDIIIDGDSLKNFNPNVHNYELRLPYQEREPDIKGVTTINRALEYEEVSEGVYKIFIQDETGKVSTYTVNYKILPPVGPPEGMERLEIVSVMASSEPQPENPAKAAIDGRIETRWSANGHQEWIQFELAKPEEISAVTIALLNGDSRVAYLDILVSADGNQWNTVFSGESSGLTIEDEQFVFEPEKAKFVKLVCKGTSSGTWNSVCEVNIFK